MGAMKKAVPSLAHGRNDALMSEGPNLNSLDRVGQAQVRRNAHSLAPVTQKQLGDTGQRGHLYWDIQAVYPLPPMESKAVAWSRSAGATGHEAHAGADAGADADAQAPDAGLAAHQGGVLRDSRERQGISVSGSPRSGCRSFGQEPLNPALVAAGGD